MPSPASLDEFADLIRKSGVLGDDRLNPYLVKLKNSPEGKQSLADIAGFFVRDGLLTYFQAEQFLQGRWKRFTIGKYKVLERLGSGGMGQVFLCEHKLMRRRVAVKVLPTSKANDPSSLERFYREARAVAALDHPNIVRAYDIDEEDSLHFLVMEYVDGSSLQDLVRKAGKLDVLRACHYVYWAAVGLQSAHDNGLIHRDIKPGNILVDRTGVVKILDLGLARFFNDDEDLLTKKYDESVLGTADYLAPEQAIDSHTVDGRADIYSLGATFYFMLTGSPPFPEGTIAQKLLWHQQKEPKSIRVLRPDVPEPIVAILEKMMAKNPKDRYQTPNELAEAILPYTQEPIYPPSDDEMPVLSSAALANSGSSSGLAPKVVMAPRTPAVAGIPLSTTVDSNTKISSVTPSVPQTISQGNSGVESPPSPPAPNVVPSRLTVEATHTTPATPKQEFPQTIAPTPPPIWESVAWETTNTRHSDTDRKRRGEEKQNGLDENPLSGRRSSQSGVKRKRSKGKGPLLVALGMVFLLFVGVVGFGVWFLFLRNTGDGTNRPDNPNNSPKQFVVGKGAAYPTLREAIQAVGSNKGATIILQDEEISEVIVIPTGFEGLTIEPQAGKRVVWKAPPSVGSKPDALLALSGSQGLKLRNITFQVDRNADSAIRVGGHCPNLLIDNVEIYDPLLAGITLTNCIADRAAPMTIQNARIATSSPPEPGKVSAGMVIRSDPPTNNRIYLSRSIDIHHCRIEGPFSYGICLEGSSDDLRIRQNRIFQTTDAIFIKKLVKAEQTQRLDVMNNTFLPSGKGIVFEDVSLMNKPDTKFLFENNLFMSGQMVVQGNGNYNGQWISSSNNFRKKGVNPGTNHFFNCKEIEVSIIQDPKSPQFLTYPDNHPLAKAANGKPVGYFPE